MKKLLFTAMAVVTFTNCSIASIFEFKNDVRFEVKLYEYLNSPTPSDCASARIFYYDYLITQGVQHNEASGRSYQIYFQCMGKVDLSFDKKN